MDKVKENKYVPWKKDKEIKNKPKEYFAFDEEDVLI